MKTFIENLAEFLVSDLSKLSNTVVIFPNKRPTSFLFRAIGKLSAVPVFAPECYSIKEFVFKQINYLQTDNVTLLFQLYSTYLRVNKEAEAKEFEHFISSGEIMLADFNDIDNYLINAKELFENLTDAKAIEAWHPGKPDFTEIEKSYLKYYRSLFSYYTEYKQDLKSKDIAYDGMAYRDLAEKCISNDLKIPPKKYIFAGFNALNKSEQEIFKYFKNNANTVFFWDADVAYVDDREQEAGYFLRENFKMFSKSEIEKFNISDDLLKTKKNIRIIGAPLALSQIKYAGLLINNMKVSGEIELSDTVFVPGDESTLPIILDSIPDEIEKLNVTMGYAVKNSVIHGFISAIFKLHFNSKTIKNNPNQLNFNYNDLLIFFQNPYFEYLLPLKLFDVQRLVNEMLGLNKVYVSTAELAQIFEKNSISIDDNVLSIFTAKKNPIEFCELCIEICKKILANFSKNEDVEKSMTSSLLNVFFLLNEYISGAKFKLSLNSFEILFNKLTSKLQVPFEGEPLQGLQLMGMLETRCLDFKNIVITSLNESFIPSGGKSMQTFIPFDLRKEYEMPMPFHNDAMFAYYFYRLLQKAENVFLLYNTEPDELSGKEMSRFIKQILYEFSIKSNGNWQISHKILMIDSSTDNNFVKKEIFVKNSELISDFLRKKAESGFSSSNLFDYIECPFRYFLKNIVGVEEAVTEVEESIAMNIFGTIVHKSIEKLYSEFSSNEIINAEKLKLIKKLIPETMLEICELEYKGGDMDSGKNYLIYNIALQMITNLVESDIKNAEQNELIIKAHELSSKVAFKNIDGVDVNLIGKIDRVDILKGDKRIVDYKTGKLKSLNFKFKKDDIELIDLKNIDNQKFQLLFYLLLCELSPQSWFGSPQNTSDEPVAGIVSLLKSNAEFISLTKNTENIKTTDTLIKIFKEELEELISEILDKTNRFSRTTDEKKCLYCSYNSICNNIEIINDNEEVG